MLAHGSGADDTLLFLTVPIAYGIYRVVRSRWAKARGRVWPEPIEPPASMPSDDDPSVD